MLRLGHGREHGIAVSGHLRMLAEDVLPTAVVQHNPPPVGIDYVSNNSHDRWILMASEVLHGRAAPPTR